jgi:hypothetical protein
MKFILAVKGGIRMHQNDLDLDDLLITLNVEALGFSTRFINDPIVRQKYMRNIKRLSDEYKWKVRDGGLPLKKAAKKVNIIRNQLMEAQRRSLSDLGLAYSQKQKPIGKTLGELTERYAGDKFSRQFNQLSKPQQNQVYLENIESAGRNDFKTTILARTLSPLGRGIMFITTGIIIYNIATANDKLMAAAEEGAALGGGILGGMAGGAAAGLVCGPGAPVCVTIGVFIGGALGAAGTYGAWVHWLP